MQLVEALATALISPAPDVVRFGAEKTARCALHPAASIELQDLGEHISFVKGAEEELRCV
jgi:hypothetical protein